MVGDIVDDLERFERSVEAGDMAPPVKTNLRLRDVLEAHRLGAMIFPEPKAAQR